MHILSIYCLALSLAIPLYAEDITETLDQFWQDEISQLVTNLQNMTNKLSTHPINQRARLILLGIQFESKTLDDMLENIHNDNYKITYCQTRIRELESRNRELTTAGRIDEAIIIERQTQRYRKQKILYDEAAQLTPQD